MSAERIPARLLHVGAAILASWIAWEGYSGSAYIPTQGDVPTIGHGATQYEDGRRVRLSDPPISRQRAAELAQHGLENRYGACVRTRLGDTPMHPTEFAQAVDFAGQYGCGAWEKSSMARLYTQGDYQGACGAYLRYKYAAGYDCSTPGNRRCAGVWTRQQARHSACSAAVQAAGAAP